MFASNNIVNTSFLQGHGEDILSSSTLPPDSSRATIITEWRKACERIYKRAVGKLRFKGGGNGHTTVLSDTRCNGHITAENAYERPVRLPAAIKGAKQAGAGRDPNVLLVNAVQDMYVGLAEDKVIPKAHQRSYVKRLKNTISAITDDSTGVQLTDDSEGEGGDDTSKFVVFPASSAFAFVSNLISCRLFFRGIAWFLHCGHSWCGRSSTGC